MSRGLSYYKYGSYYEQLKSKQSDVVNSVDPRALGLKDEASLNAMILTLRHYPYWDEDMPTDVTKSEIYNHVLISKTKSIQERIRNDNQAEISFLSGLEKVDNLEATGMDEISKYVKQPAQVLIIYGFMGRGKTMLAESIGEKFDADFESGEVASNLETAEEFKTIKSYPDLKEWLDATGNASTSNEKLFIFDEASSHATSLTGEQQQKSYNLLLPLIKQIRKANARIILIGHTDVDIAKDIRRLSLTIEKTGEQKATVYDRGEDGSRLFSLYNIPKPSESYRHDTEREEFATWEWSEQTSDGSVDMPDEIIEALDIPSKVESKGDLIRWLRNDLDLKGKTVKEITGDESNGQDYYL